MKLLIAEDDLTSRTILESVARKWGYEPIAVEDGESAWQILQQEDPPQLLLLDWEMPRLSGIDLCQRIRKQEQSDPSFIILLTSRASTQDIVTGLEAGSNEYIAKPFENAELQARLKVGKRMLELQAIRKQSEKDKARLQRELQQTRKMEALGQITGGIAHDFNNILGIIMGYTNMALDRYGEQVPEQMKGYLETALKSSERAKELVSKMLIFTHGDDPEFLPLQLVTQIEDNIDRLHSVLPGSINIEFSSEDELPEILLDPEKLQQLLQILCDNAKDAMDGKGTIKIHVGWHKNINKECADCHKLLTGDWIELSISDSGTGMSAETVEHIFEPFFTTKDFGKGMGMAMFQSIINRNSRHSLIETGLGEGSKISILFPVS